MLTYSVNTSPDNESVEFVETKGIPFTAEMPECTLLKGGEVTLHYTLQTCTAKAGYEKAF